MSNLVIVNVMGAAGVGKTTIAKIIYDALAAHDITVKMELLDGHLATDPILNGEQFEQRIEGVKSKTGVLVREVQMSRSSGF